MTYWTEPLADHDLEPFSCGNDALDEWLHRHARTAAGQGTRTYVLVDMAGAVLGYFAVTPHYLNRDEAPPRLAPGAPRQIPAILLAKLAVDASIQGQGLGAELLVRALDTIVDAARRPGGEWCWSTPSTTPPKRSTSTTTSKRSPATTGASS